jgi:CBS-domain-containing membrane protein
VKVADLMTRDVRACAIHDSLNAAARIMWEHDCGCTPVVDAGGRLAGIITDRDICMAAYTQGLPLQAIPVERAMSPRVISCSRGDDVEAALRLMRTHEIHRIPVADPRGRLLGMLSLSDVANHVGENQPGLVDARVVSAVWATFTTVRRRRMPLAAPIQSNGDGTPEFASPRPPRKPRAPRRKPSADRP